MTRHDHAQRRERRHDADPDHVEVRDPEPGDADGLFRIRMPVTSTGEARDGDAFSEERVRGFRDQLREGRTPLFLDHGRGGPGETRYGQLRKVGYWDAPSMETRGGATELDADAVLVDPDTLDEDVGEIRAALSWLRAQAEAGLPISASVGWSEQTGDRDVAGDADLLEISIVGIPSDPRTTTTADVARATRSTDVAPESFARALAARGIRPFGPPDGDGDEFDDFEDCVETLLAGDDDLDREDAEAICGAWQSETKSARQTRVPVPDEYSHDDLMEAKAHAEELAVDAGAIHAHGEGEERSFMPGASHVSLVAHLRQEGLIDAEGDPVDDAEANSARARAEYEVGDSDTTVDLTPPEAMQNAAALALSKSDSGLGEDCGTGVGSQRARQIVDDEVGPDVVDEVAAYLTSHEEDVTADGTPSEWSDEEWDDCGNIQYAKWGGLGTGTSLEWAQRKANEVARARDEEEPYPDRAARHTTTDSMTDRNIDDPEFAEGDAVMWSSQDTPVHGRVAGVHEEFSPNEDVTITGDDGEAVYSIYEWDDSLSPPAFQNSPSDPNIAKPQSSLSESNKDMPPATEENFSGNNQMTDDDTDGRMDEPMEKMMERMVEMQEQQLEMMEEMYESGYGGDGEGGEESADPDDEAEAEADADTDRTITLNGEETTPDEAVADLREAYDNVDPDDPDAVAPATTDRAAETETDDQPDDQTDDIRGFGFAAVED